MAVTTEKSTQVTSEDAGTVTLEPKDKGGRVRHLSFDFTQGAAAGDATSTQDLFIVPANTRLLGILSQLKFSAFGAARTLDVGDTADPNRFVSAADVSAAGTTNLDEADNNPSGFDVGTSPLRVFSTVAVDTIPAAATLKGIALYAAP